MVRVGGRDLRASATRTRDGMTVTLGDETVLGNVVRLGEDRYVFCAGAMQRLTLVDPLAHAGEERDAPVFIDEEDVDAAVRAGLAAYPGWRRRTGAARAKLLTKLAQLVESHGPKLAELESLNAGKPIRDSRAIDAVTAIAPPYAAPIAAPLPPPAMAPMMPPMMAPPPTFSAVFLPRELPCFLYWSVWML